MRCALCIVYVGDKKTITHEHILSAYKPNALATAAKSHRYGLRCNNYCILLSCMSENLPLFARHIYWKNATYTIRHCTAALSKTNSKWKANRQTPACTDELSMLPENMWYIQSFVHCSEARSTKKPRWTRDDDGTSASVRYAGLLIFTVTCNMSRGLHRMRSAIGSQRSPFIACITWSR